MAAPCTFRYWRERVSISKGWALSWCCQGGRLWTLGTGACCLLVGVQEESPGSYGLVLGNRVPPYFFPKTSVDVPMSWVEVGMAREEKKAPGFSLNSTCHKLVIALNWDPTFPTPPVLLLSGFHFPSAPWINPSPPGHWWTSSHIYVAGTITVAS